MSQETELETVEIKSDTENLTIPTTSIKTQEQINEEDKNLKYQNYIINFSTRIEQWKSAHGDRSLPIHWDTDKSMWVWINREQRRYK